MKTNKIVECRVSSVESGATDAVYGPALPRFNTSTLRRAFTLMEILAVITIIGVIAALILPLAGYVKRSAFIKTAQAQMSQVETALERYHSVYGFYPPNSTSGPLTNHLYFELVGTTNTPTEFQTLDSSAQITSAEAGTLFGVSGFMNCNKPGGDESAPHAQNFLPDLKLNQIATLMTDPPPNIVKILVASSGGPDPTYQPCGLRDVNPWRYVYPGTQNPGSYDLWVQLQIAGQKYLICNWTKQVQVNSPYP